MLILTSSVFTPVIFFNSSFFALKNPDIQSWEKTSLVTTLTIQSLINGNGDGLSLTNIKTIK